MPEYKLPDVGEGLTEAEIVTWRVKEGDQVAVNDVIVEIETAKSIVELPSPYAGTVTAILVPEGETVPVGTPIVAIGVREEAAPAAAAPAAPAAAGAEPIDTNVPPDGNPTLVGYGPKQTELRRRPRKVASGAAAAQVQTQAAFDAGPAPMVEAENGGSGGEVGGAAARGRHGGSVVVLAKPPVRKLAKDLGIDLASVTPTGPGGTVTRADVEAAMAGALAGHPVRDVREGPEVEESGLVARHATGGDRETREPVKGVRKMMAAAMVESAFTAPHVTEWVSVDATATVELVARLKQRRELRDTKVTPLLVIAKAALLAMRRTPLVNSTWEEAAGEVVVKHYVNLGIAAATPRGLVVPNVKDADALSLPELAKALQELTATAREGRTQPADMAGGTFTITNAGVFGVDGATPIINPGESAILCVGAIKPQPWVVDGQVVPRQVMTLTLSFDHRHIDGATGSQFLADVAAIVENPATALMF